MQLGQELKLQDFTKQPRYSLWALRKFQENPTFEKQILLGNEAHFCPNRYAIKQHFRAT